jgi:hypothetical protein
MDNGYSIDAHHARFQLSCALLLDHAGERSSNLALRGEASGARTPQYQAFWGWARFSRVPSEFPQKRQFTYKKQATAGNCGNPWRHKTSIIGHGPRFILANVPDSRLRAPATAARSVVIVHITITASHAQIFGRAISGLGLPSWVNTPSWDLSYTQLYQTMSLSSHPTHSCI